MELLQYILVALAVYAAVYLGMLLAFNSPEELKPGRRYFDAAEKLVYIAVIVLFMYAFDTENIILSIGLLAIALFFIKYLNTNYAYILLAVIFYLSSTVAWLFTIQACLIFLFSLIHGTIFVDEHKGMLKRFMVKKIILQRTIFPIIAILLFLLKLV